ncbi:hypothetical protein D3C86_562100 [compost metagenome]
MHSSRYMAFPLALSLTACAAPGSPAPARTFSAGEARLLGAISAQARVLISVKDERQESYQVQAGGAQTVRLTLSNAARGINTDNTDARFVKDFVLTVQDQTVTAFNGLRPEAGYELGVEWREDATLMGAGRAGDFTLIAGQTTMVNVVINKHGMIALTYSHVGNPLMNKLVVLGDTVRFGTGFSGVSPSAIALVKTFQVILGPELFTDNQPRVLTKSVMQLSDFSEFEWNTAVTDLSGPWGAGAASLNYKALNAPVPTNLTFQLLDPNGKLIGESEISVQVVSGAGLGVNLHLPLAS